MQNVCHLGGAGCIDVNFPEKSYLLDFRFRSFWTFVNFLLLRF